MNLEAEQSGEVSKRIHTLTYSSFPSVVLILLLYTTVCKKGEGGQEKEKKIFLLLKVIDGKKVRHVNGRRKKRGDVLVNAVCELGMGDGQRDIRQGGQWL